jgi:Recombinase
MIADAARVANARLAVAARKAKAEAFERRVAPLVAEKRQRGLTFRQIVAELTAEGIETSEGGSWSTSTVKKLLDRAK